MKKRISTLIAIAAVFFTLPACAGPSQVQDTTKLEILRTDIALNNATTIEKALREEKTKGPSQKDIPSMHKTHMVLDYDIYAGGLHALKAQLGMDLSKNDYTVNVAAKTNGFIGSMLPWEGQYFTEGHSNNGDLSPSVHKNISIWRGDEKKVIIEYGDEGRITSHKVEEDGKVIKARKKDEKLTIGSVDILTGAARILTQIAGQEKCEGSVDIFDGKRRFKLLFHPKGKQYLKKSKYSRFEGDALRCAIEVKPDGGRWPKKKRGWLAIQEHSLEHGGLPEIWLARINGNDGPAIPVRMLIKSKFGAVLMHLTNGQITVDNENGEPPIQTGMLFH